jgi:nitrogen regulatory protein PII
MVSALLESRDHVLTIIMFASRTAKFGDGKVFLHAQNPNPDLARYRGRYVF